MSEGIRWIKKRKGRKEGKKTRQKGEKETNGESERKKQKMKIFLPSDGPSSTIREEKSIHALRAMREYQNIGVSSNSTW